MEIPASASEPAIPKGSLTLNQALPQDSRASKTSVALFCQHHRRFTVASSNPSSICSGTL